jgi:hypothetical protein
VAFVGAVEVALGLICPGAPADPPAPEPDPPEPLEALVWPGALLALEEPPVLVWPGLTVEAPGAAAFTWPGAVALTVWPEAVVFPDPVAWAAPSVDGEVPAEAGVPDFDDEPLPLPPLWLLAGPPRWRAPPLGRSE